MWTGGLCPKAPGRHDDPGSDDECRDRTPGVLCPRSGRVGTPPAWCGGDVGCPAAIALRRPVGRGSADAGDRPGRRALRRLVRGVVREPARRPPRRPPPAGERPRRPGTPPRHAGRLDGRHRRAERGRAGRGGAPGRRAGPRGRGRPRGPGSHGAHRCRPARRPAGRPHRTARTARAARACAAGRHAGPARAPRPPSGARVEVRLLREVAATLPAVRRTGTYDSDSNRPVVAVNEALGFRRAGRLSTRSRRI